MSLDPDLDDVDLEILDLLQRNARIQNAEIARRVGMAPSATLERLRKLERRGVVHDYRTRLDPARLGFDLLAFVFVRTKEDTPFCAGEKLAALPEVQELHHVAGEDCYLLKLRAASPEALGRLLRERLREVPEVISTRSTIVLDTVKDDPALPLRIDATADEGPKETP
ncbi:MAG: Lrp/AsnC family transcriptional regulator [Acidobacteriota bacterium]